MKKDKLPIILGIFFSLAIITFLIYIREGKPTYYSHLYYIPIIVAAFYCGLRVSLIVAILASTLYVPFNLTLFSKIFSSEVATEGLIVRSIVFLTVALVSGFYTEIEKKRKEKAEGCLDDYLFFQKISGSILSTLDLEKLLDEILKFSCDIIKGTERGLILFKGDQGNTVKIGSVYGYSKEMKGRVVESTDPHIKYLFQSKEASVFLGSKINEHRHCLSQILENPEDSKSASVIEAPIVFGGCVRGVIILHNMSSHDAFSQKDANLLQSVVEQVAVSIQNAELYKGTQQKAAEFTILYEVGKAFASTLDLEKLLNFMLECCLNTMEADTGSIMLLDKNTNTLKINAAKGINKETKGVTSLKQGESVAGWVAMKGEPLLLGDLSKDPRFKHLKGRDDICSALSVPLKIKDDIIGVINIGSRSQRKFSYDDLRFLSTLATQAAVSIHNAQLFDQLEIFYMETVKAFAETIEAKDSYTRGHSDNVAKYSIEIAKKMKLTGEETGALHTAALLHDIGKIGVREAILNKSTNLNDEEYELVKKHPRIATQIIGSIPKLKEVVPLILHHHERYDGNGYLAGLKGENIPFGSRILAVADSFDAMTSKRPYRKALSVEEAIQELLKNSGKQFDPEIVSVFVGLIREKFRNTRNVKYFASVQS
ncbi:MAG TPA: GAF domain-containing protein [Actinobacteria bacterium]|nr:GAF domain-containing protein [Actinomycetota bacterium]